MCSAISYYFIGNINVMFFFGENLKGMFSSYFGLDVLRFSFNMAHLVFFSSLNIIALKTADDITCTQNVLTGSKYKMLHVYVQSIKRKIMYDGSACVYSQQVLHRKNVCGI